MKILVLGSDGYIGYPLTLHLLKQGHEVWGVDNYSRRKRVNELKSDSLTPILSTIGRIGYLKNQYKDSINHSTIHLGTDPPGHIKALLKHFKPDTIVHLAEQPSAPWSMQGVNYASATQHGNVIGTLDLLWAIHEECPETHLVKLGTMGEYGTPNCDIPEGRISNQPCHHIKNTEEECPMAGLLFPRTAGSFYHLSKVHDTLNIHFACRNWRLRSTDIMQGVVFGLTNSDKIEELTRFDYDECFGTVINRFCVQAIVGQPLTVYGTGYQTRGFLTLNDSIQCLTLAIENPPSIGEYRTLNQFENTYTVLELSNIVRRGAYNAGVNIKMEHIDNPRKEAESHYYNPTRQKLFDLGYVPTTDIEGEITKLIQQLLPFRNRIHEEVISPKIMWE
jgi:nucleoside-diphosphate-sugar epimerase